MSAVPEGRFADIGSVRIHYHEAGPANGSVVLFLHGSGPGASGFSNYRRNFPYFADAGFRALVPDTVGFGYSSKPTDVDYTLDYLAGHLTGFLDALGISRCAIVGNSHGGALALRLALSAPERVSRLILMAPGGLDEREAYVKLEGIQAMVQAVFQPGGIDREGMRRVLSLQLYDQQLLTDDIIDERWNIAKLQPKRVLATLQVPNLSGELATLRPPVLGFWGTDDKFCPVSGAMTLAKSCPAARVLLLSRSGHWVMVEQSELFNRMAVEFLREETREA
jgi:4,5:9,10-diseco-3-hydroxy-5,9,17-trioxoandrosta-1(10),2-diene-4-oate hydrolase